MDKFTQVKTEEFCENIFEKGFDGNFIERLLRDYHVLSHYISV